MGPSIGEPSAAQSFGEMTYDRGQQSRTDSHRHDRKENSDRPDRTSRGRVSRDGREESTQLPEYERERLGKWHDSPQ